MQSMNRMHAVPASLEPPIRYVCIYIYTCDHFQPLDLAFDLDNWPSIIPNDHVSPNKRCSIDNLALRVILFFLEANFRTSFLPLVLFLIPNENISSFSVLRFEA